MRDQKTQEDIEDENDLLYPEKVFIIASLLVLIIALILVIGAFLFNAFLVVGPKEFAKR